MIPLLQNDYYKYNQMFRGNYLKGATLLRSLLNDPNTREQILESLPALSAIFTDFSKCEATRQCYNVLSDTAYFDIALINYLQGIEQTNHETIDALLNDAENVVALLSDEQMYPLFRDNTALLHDALEKKETFDLLRLNENAETALQEEVVTQLSLIQSRTVTNIYTSYSTYYNSIDNDVCEFDANETYYDSTPYYEWAILDDVNMQVFLPAQLRTRVGSTSTYYYYPAVFKYDIDSATWTLLHVAMTDVKNTGSQKTAKAVAYDPSRDNVYLFYRADTGVQMCCDIIRGATGAVITSGLSIGAVGNASYMSAYYCYFDKKYGIARFVWDTYAMNSTNSTYGWLYGCSVNQSGLVWSGIVATPSKDVTAYYSSEMQTVSYGYRARCPAGAFVGCFSNSSANTSAATMAFIVPTGVSMDAKYIVLPSTTDYTDFYSASDSRITENGLFIFYAANATYADKSQNVVLVIDIPRGKLVKTYTASNTFTTYVSPLLNKVAIINKAEGSPYIYIGIDEAGNAVTHSCSTLHSIFSTEYMSPHNTDMYKMYAYNSSNFNLYKYGGFTE